MGSLPDDGSSAALEQELARLRRRVAELEATPPRHPVRQTLTAVLGVVTVLVIIAATFGAWTSRTALQTDRFMAVVEPVLVSPEVADALSVRISEEVLTALAIQDRLEQRLTELQEVGADALAAAAGVTPEQRARIEALPVPELSGLAEPIASGLEARIVSRIDQLVTSPEFASLLVGSTELAHTKAVALLRGDYEQLPNVEVIAGEVRLNLLPVIAGILQDLVDEGLAAIGIEEIPFIDPFADPAVSLQRLESALGADLPEDLGTVTVMSQADLEELQALTRTADRLSWLLVVAAIVLFAGTIAAAPRKRRALIMLSIGTAAAAVATMALLRSTTDQVAGLALTPQGETAVALMADAVLDSLRATMLIVLVVALVVAAAAYLLSRPAWLQASLASAGGNDFNRFVARHYDPLRLGALALAVFVIFLTGVTLWSLLIVSAIALLGLWGLSVARARAVDDPQISPPSSADPAPVARPEREDVLTP